MTRLLPFGRLALAGVVAATLTVAPMSAATAVAKTKDQTTKTSPAGKGIGRKAH